MFDGNPEKFFTEILHLESKAMPGNCAGLHDHAVPEIGNDPEGLPRFSAICRDANDKKGNRRGIPRM